MKATELGEHIIRNHPGWKVEKLNSTAAVFRVMDIATVFITKMPELEGVIWDVSITMREVGVRRVILKRSFPEPEDNPVDVEAFAKELVSWVDCVVREVHRCLTRISQQCGEEVNADV